MHSLVLEKGSNGKRNFYAMFCKKARASFVSDIFAASKQCSFAHPILRHEVRSEALHVAFWVFQNLSKTLKLPGRVFRGGWRLLQQVVSERS